MVLWILIFNFPSLLVYLGLLIRVSIMLLTSAGEDINSDRWVRVSKWDSTKLVRRDGLNDSGWLSLSRDTEYQNGVQILKDWAQPNCSNHELLSRFGRRRGSTRWVRWDELNDSGWLSASRAGKYQNEAQILKEHSQIAAFTNGWLGLAAAGAYSLICCYTENVWAGNYLSSQIPHSNK